MGLLDGKVAIVTGAGRGIGREHALLLAHEGAAVVVNDVGGSVRGEGGDSSPAHDVVDAIVASGGSAMVNGDDISTWKGAANLVDETVAAYGTLNVLVNNAGILRDKMSFGMEESDWDDVVRVHLKGHFAMSHFAAIHWRERAKSGETTSGRIINTTSESGIFGNAGQSNYAAAKAGIVSLTMVLARELERYGVTVNAIAPRARTRMTEGVFEEMAKTEDGFDKFDPKNVAQLVGFLASDHAADINGQILVVYGGDITVMGGYHPIGEIRREGPWTPSELIEAKAKLFNGISSKIDPFQFF